MVTQHDVAQTIPKWHFCRLELQAASSEEITIRPAGFREAGVPLRGQASLVFEKEISTCGYRSLHIAHAGIPSFQF